VAVTRSTLATPSVAGVTLRRNNELELIFDLTSRERRKDKPQRYPPGTVRRADDEIEFDHAAGWKSVVRGVIERDWRSRSNAVGENETVETYSAQSVEIDLRRQIPSSYVVEWILNVPDGLIWTEPVRFSGLETLTKAVGSGDAEIRMTRTLESGGGNQSLHLRIPGTDLYIMKSSDRDDDNNRKTGQIVYRGCPDQALRDKVRTCLSFILGKPIVYLGHTEYCVDWNPSFHSRHRRLAEFWWGPLAIRYLVGRRHRRLRCNGDGL
jgi:hypothetical protein